MLYRLGAKAYLTLGNEKSIDIRITKDDGSWISVDVKSVRKGNAIPVGNAVDKDNHYYVFVIYNNKFSDLSVHPDFYIVPSLSLIHICFVTGSSYHTSFFSVFHSKRFST